MHRGPTETGMARLTLTDDDAKVRKWFADEVQKLGCSLSVDQMGNMFARQSGSMKSSAPMIAMGSHLDTQPRGGRYDGILGVMAALEVLRTMKENNFRTSYDVGIVNWTKSVCSFIPFVPSIDGSMTDAYFEQRGGSSISKINVLLWGLGWSNSDSKGVGSA